jgi:hypothetical protein
MAETSLATTVHELDEKVMAALVTGGDCSALSDAQRAAYYRARCDAAGLDYRTQPFEFMRLNGKMVLYARKAAADGLTLKHGISTTIVEQRNEADLRIVTVRAMTQSGRSTEEIGAVPIKGVQGEALANAMMKAVTKAKRRAVLSLTGLGMLDETEVDSIPGAQTVQVTARMLETLPAVDRDAEQAKANAAALVEQAAAAQPASELVQRGRVLWRRATDRARHAMTPPMFQAWVVEVLGAQKPSAQWTEADLDALENALDRKEEVP